MKQAVQVVVLWLSLGISGAQALGIPQVQYLAKEDFLASAFNATEPGWKMLRLNRDLKQRVSDVLKHSYSASRIRYWHSGQRTAWIIDEIGKEQPITMGVVVENDKIVQLEILVYREERGGDVHEGFFTRQFVDVYRQANGLSKQIDGITGATLSVNAVTRVAELVLMLHQVVQTQLAANH